MAKQDHDYRIKNLVETIRNTIRSGECKTDEDYDKLVDYVDEQIRQYKEEVKKDLLKEENYYGT